MNKIDFTFPGGFPLDQDVLDVMQGNYNGVFNLMFADAGTTPVIISGMEQSFVTNVGGMSYWKVNSGLFYLNGEVYYMPESMTPDILTVGNDYCIYIVESKTALEFEDGNFNDVMVSRIGGLAKSLPNANFIPYSSFKKWTEFAGELCKTEWFSAGSFGNTAADVECSMTYKLNRLTNTLHIKGTMNVNVAQSLPAGGASITFFTLPVGFRPSNRNINLQLPTGFAGGMKKDVTGFYYIQHLDTTLSTTGQFVVYFPKPEASVANYGCDFNFMIPLD